MGGTPGVPPPPGDRGGGVPPPPTEVGIKYTGEGRKPATGSAVPSAWGAGLWGTDAGALAAGGGAVRDETRSTGCAGIGAALRRVAAETTQAAVAIACGSFSHAARVPVQARQVQVTQSNTIIGIALAPDDQRCGPILGWPEEPLRGPRYAPLHPINIETRRLLNTPYFTETPENSVTGYGAVATGPIHEDRDLARPHPCPDGAAQRVAHGRFHFVMQINAIFCDDHSSSEEISMPIIALMAMARATNQRPVRPAIRPDNRPEAPTEVGDRVPGRGIGALLLGRVELPWVRLPGRAG